MSLKDADWWLPFVSRLQEESLSALCEEFGLIEEAVIPELVAGTEEDAIHETLWWPEVVRQIEDGESIRVVARRFGTHSRRLRKGLVRSGGSFAALSAEDEPDSEVSEISAEPAPEASESSSRSRAEPMRALGRLPRVGDEPQEEDSRRKRRGRLRIVRPDAVDEAPMETAPRRAPRKPKTSPHSEVRVISLEEADLSELVEELSEAAPRPAEVEPAAVELAAVEDATVEDAAVEEAAVEPIAAEPVEAPPLSAAPITAEPIAAAPSEEAPALELVREAAPIAAAPPAVKTGGLAWRVRVDGDEQPMVVIADNIGQAAAMFQEQLGLDALRRADIYSVPIL